MALFYQHNTNEHVLGEEESGHAVRVLRKKNGDFIEITDGNGSLIKAKIIDANPKACAYEIISKETQPKPSKTIHLAIAPTKNTDRMEWLVEKLVEIGVTEISLLLCEHSERKVYKTDRLHKIAIAAMKQSGNLYLPKINELQPFKQFIAKNIDTLKLIALLDEKTLFLEKMDIAESEICLLVGPEGDFSANEIKMAKESGFNSVLMGSNRLRTETAGLVGVTLLKFS
jgi:16S rRNA (uracil1498-N3)-methyltransferase